MFENLAKKLADLLINYSVSIEKGDSIFIEGSIEAVPLIDALYRQALRAGGHPNTRVIPPGQKYTFFKEAQQHQLEYVNPFDMHMIQNVDAFIRIYSDLNLQERHNVPTEKTQAASLAEGEIMKAFFQRNMQGDLKWCVVPWPTNAKAQRAKMSTEEYAEMLERVCFLDRADPAGEWKRLGQEQQKIIEKISRVDKLHFLAPGTDLTMSVKGRNWINCDGKEDLPDGEIFTAPIEDSVNGVVRFSFPARHAEGIRLVFKDGLVVEHAAEKGEEHLTSTLDIPGARRLGEVGIGTNYAIDRYVGDILCDEKIGGTFHLALGAAYPESGGTNVSGLHWDILTDMRADGKIFGDGELIYQNGKFLF